MEQALLLHGDHIIRIQVEQAFTSNNSMKMETPLEVKHLLPSMMQLIKVNLSWLAIQMVALSLYTEARSELGILSCMQDHMWILAHLLVNKRLILFKQEIDTISRID